MDNSDEVFGKNLTVYGAAMTNDKQVEVWRTEFCEINKSKRDTTYSGGFFLEITTHWLWLGFKQCKESMQPIDLPECFWKDCEAELAEEIIEAITAAGYSYMVKE